MEKTFHAYCWDAAASGEYDNLTVMVDSRDGAGTRMTPAEAKAALSLKSAGRRFLLDTYATWNGETSDQLFTNGGSELWGEKTLWLMNGISSVRTYNGDWWRDFRDLNGLVDFFSSDQEEPYGVWNTDYDEAARTVWYADDRGYNSVNPGHNDLTGEIGFFDWHLNASLYGAGGRGDWPGPNYLSFEYVASSEA